MKYGHRLFGYFSKFHIKLAMFVSCLDKLLSKTKNWMNYMETILYDLKEKDL